VERVVSVDSTNAELLRRAGGGAPAGVVLVADEQTSGRGRLGRVWEAPRGSSLLVSVLLRPELQPGEAHLATVCAALAGVEACATVAGVRPGIKWPNDLVVGDRKLAGLLTESLVTGDRLDALVVGMGLNVRWPRPMPDELAATATALNHEMDETASPAGADDGGIALDEVLDAWLAALAPRLDQLTSAEGRVALARDHRAGCVTLGRRVRVERTGTDSTGTAVDLTEEGHLVVDDGRSRTVVAVGDVVHLR
jgi:BirA family biotin operon repressor/biotin-[acetyl-CoA-carboxylase] ligase